MKTNALIACAALIASANAAFAQDNASDSLPSVQVESQISDVQMFHPPWGPGPGGGPGYPGGHHGYPGGGYPGGGYPGDGYPGGGWGVIDVQCSSQGYQPAYCPTGPARSAELAQQLSYGRGACIAGRTWGFDGRGIWVNSGCRGIFRLYR